MALMVIISFDVFSEGTIGPLFLFPVCVFNDAASKESSFAADLAWPPIIRSFFFHSPDVSHLHFFLASL